jgi:hypothetical protein
VAEIYISPNQQAARISCDFRLINLGTIMQKFGTLTITLYFNFAITETGRQLGKSVTLIKQADVYEDEARRMAESFKNSNPVLAAMNVSYLWQPAVVIVG